MEMIKPLRGEVYQVRLEPAEGNETKKYRPAVVISSDAINKASDVVIICPITNPIGKGSPIHILIAKGEGGLTKDGIAHCGQIRAIDKTRLGAELGTLHEETMRKIDMGLRNALHLR